jgi:hypothetical protein
MVINGRAFISKAALATFFGLSNSSPGDSSQQTLPAVQ